MVIINTSSGIPKKYVDAGDAANKSLIDAEVTNRTNADTTLQNNINAEATTRANADTALGKRIDDVEADINGLGTAAHKNVGTASGEIPILNSKGQLPDSVIPPLAIGQPVGTVNTVNDLKTLTTAQTGDFAFVTGESDKSKNGTYILAGTAYNSADAWKKIATPDLVWGNITGTLANQSDLQTALNAKLDKSAYFGPSSAGTDVQTFYGGGKGWQNLAGSSADTGYDDALGLYSHKKYTTETPTAASVLDSIECALGNSIKAAKIPCRTEAVDSTDTGLPEGYAYRLASYILIDSLEKAGPWIARSDSNQTCFVISPGDDKTSEWWQNAEVILKEVQVSESGVSWTQVRAYSKVAYSPSGTYDSLRINAMAFKIRAASLDVPLIMETAVDHPWGF